MKKRNVFLLLGFVYFGNVFAAAQYRDLEGLPQVRCVCEGKQLLSYAGCCQIEEKRAGGVNLAELAAAMHFSLKTGNLREFKLFLNDCRFVRKFDEALVSGLLCCSGAKFCVALLRCDRVVGLLGRKKLRSELLAAAGRRVIPADCRCFFSCRCKKLLGDLDVLNAIFKSSQALSFLKPEYFRQAFVLAAGLGHADVINCFLETKTRSFDFFKIIDENTANDAVKFAEEKSHLEVIYLLFKDERIQKLLTPETVRSVMPLISYYVKNSVQNQWRCSSFGWLFNH